MANGGLKLWLISQPTTTAVPRDDAAREQDEYEYDSDSDTIVVAQPTVPPRKRKVDDPPQRDTASDDDADPIVVAQPTLPSRKREVTELSHGGTVDAQQRFIKKARLHRLTKPFTSRQVTEFLASDVRTTATTKRGQTKKTQSSSSRRNTRQQPDTANAPTVQELCREDGVHQQRAAFKELTEAQFQQRMRGPIAFFKRPPRDKHFISEIDSMTQGCELHMKQWTIRRDLRHQNAQNEQEMATQRTAYAQRRPKRATVSRSYVIEDVNDEIADGRSEAIAPKRTTRRNVRSRSQEESSFGEESATSFIVQDDEDIGIDLESEGSVQASEEESDEDEVKPKKPKRRSAATNHVKAVATSKKTKKRMKKLFDVKRGRGLETALPPCSDIRDIFADMTKRALELNFDVAAKHLASRPLRVATMCSGTESPLLALQMIQDCLKSGGKGICLHVEHLFSAEIVPYKQAFIERNFRPPIIFRDITELTTAFIEKEPMATTAYGGKVLIPRDLDMLIAGTSCVDFSGQNSHKKGLDDGGESGDTFHAVLAFCRADRPGIVILENVSGAPYDAMMTAYETIGYEVAGVLVDTKDFYLPQTRQRGYMIAFDKGKLTKGGAASEWQSLMEQFRRPASSSVSSYLLPRERVKARVFRNDDDVAHEVDWSNCEITQSEYRQEKRLGMGRPYTFWSTTGSSQPPDYSHQDWVRNGVERVKDTMDAAILRKRLEKNGMCDIQFKTRVIDLSQNVYREQDARPFGIAGCLTPSGQPWISDAGRGLAPEESLQLQGLPLHKISLTTETPAQIQDLAGNAMSSTVIGSAIMSALIAGYVVVPDRHLTGMEEGTPREFAVSVKEDLTTQSTTSITVAHDPLALIKSKAHQAMRRCYCEAITGVAKKPIQKCQDCGHTTCTGCGGNPAHSYRLSPILTNVRVSSRDFEQELRAVMPISLQICSDSTTVLNALRKAGNINKQYLQAAVTALTGLFTLQYIEQTDRCEVTYRTTRRDGGSARLVLRVTEYDVEWRLYADAPPQLPVNSALRKLLRTPVARMSISKDLYTGQFVLRVPSPKAISLQVKGTGDKIASVWQRDGMPDFKNHVLWQFLTISIDAEADGAMSNLLSGRYRHLPSCGTANGSLYLKDAPSESSQRPVYLFLDPDKIGNPEDDCFVFAHSNARLEYGEVRDIIARIMPDWRAYTTPESSHIPASTNAKLMVEATWSPLPRTIQLAEARTDVQVYEASTNAVRSYSQTCSQACVLLRGSVPSVGCKKEGIISPDDYEFLAQNAAICESLRRHIPADHWQSDKAVPDTQSCSYCAPARPFLHWEFNESGTIKPYEDPASAAVYEQCMKSRPNPLFLSASVSGDRLQLDVIANIATLKHRAVSRLGSLSGTVPQTRWRITTCRHVTREGAFRIPKTKPMQLNNTTSTLLTVTLFPKQQEVVSWMMEQESKDGAPFELEEVEEASLPAVGLRLEVRASTTVHIRGGYCADHPGFGKTITSLALIYSQLQNASRSRIVGELDDRQRDAGLIATAATLIVCPHTLLKQWIAEITEKVCSPGKVISIPTNAALSKYTLEDFKEASIVVLNRNLFSSDAYTERLASFAAVPGPAATSGRAFSDWLKDATARIPEHLSILRPDDLTTTGSEHIDALKQRIRSTYKENIQSEKYRASVPSRRLRGANYIAAKSASKSSSTVSKVAAPEIEMTTVGQPLFEMFYWNRIIVDEAHLLEPKEHAAIVNLKADKRWALSATPALGDCVDTFHMAALLGIPLRMGRIGKGDVRAINLKRLQSEMTSFELFDAMRQTPSDSMQSHTIVTHQNFLNAFVRRNIMDYDAKLKYEEHLVLVTLRTPLMALYNEVSQHLISLAMRIKRSSKEGEERQRRLNGVIDESDSPEEALSKSATHLGLSLNLDDIREQRQRETCKVLEKLLGPAIAVAMQKEPKVFDKWRKTYLVDGNLNDEFVIKEILAMIQTIGNAKRSTKDDDDKKGRGGGDRVRTAAVNALATRFLTATRSARYLSWVATIQKAINARDTILCETPGCQGSTDLAANALCGHCVCADCHESLSKRAVTRCPASGCSSGMTETDLFWVGRTSDTASSKSVYGGKIETALDILLDKVQAQGEQAILCVQFESQLAEMEAALKHRGVTASVVKKTAAAADMIADFRNTAGTDEHKTVLVLNISDETAAGSNIQTANHVIFLGPLLRDSQYNYESTMQQVIGRVRRPGQQKQIHVWRIAARNTVDIDILEHRERRTDAMVEYGAPPIEPPAALERTAAGVEDGAERTQLVCEDGKWSLRPQSWLGVKVQGKKRIAGWGDYTSLVKFSRAFADDDDR